MATVLENVLENVLEDVLEDWISSAETDDCPLRAASYCTDPELHGLHQHQHCHRVRRLRANGNTKATATATQQVTASAGLAAAEIAGTALPVQLPSHTGPVQQWTVVVAE